VGKEQRHPWIKVPQIKTKGAEFVGDRTGVMQQRAIV
jgi:hypothetical protein